MILLGPGSTVSHDALRLLARHGTVLAAVGEDGVRFYTAPISRRACASASGECLRTGSLRSEMVPW